MKKTVLFIAMLTLAFIVWAQTSPIHETFTNLGPYGGYQTETWTGDNGGTWTATDARTDQTINGKAICIRNGVLTSPTVTGGIGSLTVTTQRAFAGGTGDMEVRVNGTPVGTVPYDGTEQTTTITDINIAGDVVVVIDATNSSSDRPKIDDLIWTAYSTGGNIPPSIFNITQYPASDITATDVVAVEADVTDSDGTVGMVELRWGTSTGTYPNTIAMSLSIGNTYETNTEIPAQAEGTMVYYVIYAEDNELDSTTSAEQSYTVIGPATTTLPYIEEFTAGLGDIITYSVSGATKEWNWNSSGWAQMNGYNSGDIEEDWLILPGINLDNYSEEIMTFDSWWQYGTDDVNNYLKLMYSTNYSGLGNPTTATWTELAYTQPASASAWVSSGNVDLSGISGTSVYIAFKYRYESGSYRWWQIDNVNVFEGTSPMLEVAPEELTGFTYIEGSGPSASQSFSLSGTNLDPASGNLTVTGSTNYEVSSDDISYAATATVAYSGGELTATDVYVRLKSGLAVGTYASETIEITGGGASAVNVTASGEVIALPPGLPYTENFSGFDSALTIPDGWLVSDETYEGDWGSGFSSGLRGNANVLGYQHTSSTGIFTATLNILNDTGSTINELYLSYLGKVERATEGRSPEWTVLVNGTEVPELFYSTSAGVDESKSVHLQGLSIANGELITIAWSSDRGEPSGSSKQIGISDVSVSTEAPSEQVATPTFSPVAGEYTTTQAVQISTTTPQATVYYSYDSDTGPWTQFNMLSPLSISETTTVWAYATKVGLIDSYVASATYTFPATATIPYEQPFASDLGDMYTYNSVGSEEWGWTTFGNPGGSADISGYVGSAQENVNWLITPAIDFSAADNPKFLFDEAINYGTGNIDNEQEVYVSTDYAWFSDPDTATWTKLTVTNRASGGSWDYVTVDEMDLSAYIGQSSVHIAFKYTSTIGGAATWQVDNINIYEGLEYYADVDGLTGAALRSGLNTIISGGHTANTEEEAKTEMYNVLDNQSGMVQCIYTGRWETAAYPPTPTDFSLEHSYPKSWYNASGDNIPEQATADWDLHHLFPADYNANMDRSTHPFDYITSVTATSSDWTTAAYEFYSYLGSNADLNTAFEVADEYKGNIARAVLYMTVRYYSDDAGLTRFGVDMLPVLYQWHEQDPVDAQEITRNELVYAKQGNRNPFVDHPEYVEAIWGNMLLATPTNPAATNIGETSFTANWDALTRAVEYRLDVSTDADFSTYAGFVSGYKNLPVTGTSESVVGLTTGTTYYFRVKAVDSVDGTLSMNSVNGSATPTPQYDGYFVNFESDNTTFISGSTGYDPGTYELNGIQWELTQALIGNLASDWKNGEYSCRIRGYETSAITMLQDKAAGIGTISFYYRRYGTDAQTDWKVEYSTNAGVDWTQIGSAFTAPDTDDVQFFSEEVNVDGNIRVRILRATADGNATNKRLNVDDILITDYDGAGQLDSPQNVQISVSGGTVTIIWDAVIGATTYRVEESDTPDGPFTPATGTLNGEEWTGTDSGSKKFYRVIAE